MPIRYISTKSTVFHPDSETDSQEFVLIFGDEVETTGIREHGRSEVNYRGRTGWVRSNRLTEHHPLEMYFVDVGQGDSAFIVTPAGRKILIDGGKGNEAFQFLVWKYRLDLPNPTPINIDLMVVTHVDSDHMEGLISIIRNPFINVQEIVHSGIAKYNSGFNTELGRTVGRGTNRVLVTRHDVIADLDGGDVKSSIYHWREAVHNEPGLTYRAVDTRTGIIDVGDPSVQLSVLGPRLVDHENQANPVFPWFGSPAHTVNGNSIVLRLNYRNVRVLLPGDINGAGSRHLMQGPNFPVQIDAHVFKAPHHGSNEYERNFLEAVRPQISVISSGESPDHGHPRADFLGAIGQVSRSQKPLLFSTELVAHFAVDADAEALDADDNVDPIHASGLGQARRRFKKRLNGIINIRTDGDILYCARRVAAGYQFVTYEQPAVDRNP